tara:strand:- start:157 stop:564 length:408 start_codon:yes stop_codon:yes gene_type:complete
MDCSFNQKEKKNMSVDMKTTKDGHEYLEFTTGSGYVLGSRKNKKRELKNYVWVKKFSITAYSRKEAVEQLKEDFYSDSVMITGRDLSVDLEYLETEKARKYDIDMYNYMKNEHSKNPKKMNFPISPKVSYSKELD